MKDGLPSFKILLFGVVLEVGMIILLRLLK